MLLVFVTLLLPLSTDMLEGVEIASKMEAGRLLMEILVVTWLVTETQRRFVGAPIA